MKKNNKRRENTVKGAKKIVPSLKKANQRIKALRKELDKADDKLAKMEQIKSDFVSIVSHELRTPLAIIKEGISLILDGLMGEINDKQRKILSMSNDNVNRLARIINDLLDISKIEAGKLELKKEAVDMRSIIREVCDKYKPELDKKQQSLAIDLPNRYINILVDRNRMREVLMNLISNASKFTPANGSIKIDLREKDNGVEVEITDNGIGISKENLAKLFDKFAQFGRTPGSGAKGTGLGLAITKHLVELHKGTIKVESKVNQGSTFTIFLPRLMDFSLKPGIKYIVEKHFPDGIH